MNCIICKTETGSDNRRTCSGSCRAKAHRLRTRTPDNVAHAVERTHTDTGIVKGGICWCCGSDINMALVCCGPCAWSGKAAAQRAGRAPVRIGDRPTLHPSIIAGINRLTTNPDGTVDEQARTNRLAAAKRYQRMFPERTYTGV
ncbi:hypothetical protein LCGC14_0659920 [marine sediment metagenome]|uniref:Uncharacterized protein n=1 Tax=marine sediment metagenome TaxID=412755 RepID=A0A0F9U278_9ZZZZ